LGEAATSTGVVPLEPAESVLQQSLQQSLCEGFGHLRRRFKQLSTKREKPSTPSHDVSCTES
jgi:hypothetical protein